MGGDRTYRTKFSREHGPPPWPCHFCKGDVFILFVHHIDGNHRNDDISNLSAAHKSCHQAYHNSLREITEETRRRMRESHLGKEQPKGAVAKRAAQMREIWKDEAYKAKVSEKIRKTVTEQWKDPEMKRSRSEAMKKAHENCNCPHHKAART